MSLQVDQDIKAGAAQLLITDAPVGATAGINTNIDEVAGYTALITALTVDDAATIAPDVWEIAAGSIGDPPIIDAICVVRTGEIMFCYSRDDTTGANVINVIRGVSKYWRKYAYTDTQYNLALVDDDELELLGSFTMPTLNDMVVTNGDVGYNITQGTFDTQDNLKGKDTSFTSEPAKAALTCTVPRNTIASTKRLLGFQGLTDGNTPTEYFSQPGRASAGSQLPSKLVVLIPNTIIATKPTVTIDGSDYLDLAECVVFPMAQPSLEESKTYGMGSQLEIALTFNCGFDDVWQTAAQEGSLSDFNRIAEIIA